MSDAVNLHLRQARYGGMLAFAAISAVIMAATSAEVTAADNNAQRAMDERVTLTISNSHLGYTYVGAGGLRYFVTEVIVTNHSGKNLSVPVASFELLVDGIPFSADVKHAKLTGYDFRVNGKSHRFRDLEQTEVLPVSDGTSGSAWLVFADLPKSQTVPDMQLQLELDGAVHRVDVNGFYDAKMQLHIDRIGPHDALGLLRIDGTLNTISVGTVVETVDQLAAARVSRIVVSFGDDASELDEPLGSWLRQTAQGIQTSRTYAMFPAVVSTIREFHVAELPDHASNGSESHVHNSVAAAVEDALATVYRSLSAEEIVVEIEKGHRLSQASALVSGGSDLPPEYLPLLLDRAQSEDRLLRRGAFIALSGSGEDSAIAMLKAQARDSDATIAALAIECLAASRYSGAHKALADLLDAKLAVDQLTLVQILARYPRSEWMQYLSELATDIDDVTPQVGREVVLALGRIGHPRLTELLANALTSHEANIREAAFNLLLSREDETSDAIALEFALTQLDQHPPTPQMLQLFDRVRDPRIAPRLMPFLDDDQFDRTAIINTLARMGPAAIDDVLVQHFASFKPTEQASVISNLTQLRSPHVLSLAKGGLDEKEDALFNASVRALTLTGEDEGVDAIVSRFLEEENISRVNNLVKSLEDIGTPYAMETLRSLRHQIRGDEDKYAAIVRQLQSLQNKSPGRPHLRVAEQHAQKEEHEAAIEHYTFALKRDPDLASAYSGRGHCWLKLEDYEQAEADFRRGIAADPDDGLAVAGLGIALAVGGNVEQAVKIIEEASPRFSKDLLFAYNAACVYGRALEQIAERPVSDERTKLQTDCRESALSRLAESIELGFSDRDWIKNDPDLASLRDLDAFQKLVAPPDEAAEDAEKDAAPPAAAPGQGNPAVPQPQSEEQ